jgi:hypothetical protein
VDREEILALLEAGPETILFFNKNLLCEQFLAKRKRIMQPVDRMKYDRFQFFLVDLKVKDNFTVYHEKNFLVHKLAVSNKFTADELAILDDPYNSSLTDEERETASALYYQLYNYQQLVETVNSFLFQSRIARGIFSAQEYDFKLYGLNSKQKLSFEGCNLVSDKKNDKNN